MALPIAVTAISFAAILFRKAAPTHALVAAGVRLAVAACVLLPWTVWCAKKGRLPAKAARAAVVAGLLYGVHFGSWVWSLGLTTIAASVTLVTATPILLALHGWVTGRDRPGPRLWAAIGLALVGVTIIGGHDLSLSRDALIGDGLALVGAAAMAAYLVIGRGLGKAVDVWAFSGVATGVGAVALLGSAAMLGISPVPPSLSAFGYLVLAALVPQLIGHALLTWSLRHARPTAVGIATVGEPVGSTLLGFLWLGERVGWLVALGCAVTLCAVVVALVGGKERATRGTG